MTPELIDQRDLILGMLREQFPDVLSISLGTAFRVSGLCKAKNPEHSARQAIHKGTFPFPVVAAGGTRRVLISVLADHMARNSLLAVRLSDSSASDDETPSPHAAALSGDARHHA